MANKADYSFVDESRTGQYRTKAEAVREARARKQPHYAMLTTCWRALEPRICWTVVLWTGHRNAMIHCGAIDR